MIANHSLRKWRGLAVGAAVEAALREDRLFFAFQPVVCAATGTVDYFECLLRMREAEGGVVSGGEFITIIEELGYSTSARWSETSTAILRPLR